jgi:hypothetical protein
MTSSHDGRLWAARINSPDGVQPLAAGKWLPATALVPQVVSVLAPPPEARVEWYVVVAADSTANDALARSLKSELEDRLPDLLAPGAEAKRAELEKELGKHLQRVAGKQPIRVALGVRKIE